MRRKQNRAFPVLRTTCILLASTLFLFAALSSTAAVLSPGVEHLQFVLGPADSPANPNRVNVIKIDRAQADISLRVGFPYARRNYPAKEIVRTIASRYDSPPANDVLAAVNCAFFGTGLDISGPVSENSNIIQPPVDSGDTFAIFDSGDFLIKHALTTSGGTLTFADASTTSIDIFNLDRLADTIAVYTPDWGASTGSTVQGTEIVLSQVSYPIRLDKQISGVVTAVQTGASSLNNAIPAGGLVISARDTKATFLASKVTVGQRLRISYGTSSNNFNNTRMLVMGQGWLLTGGVANTSNWSGYSAGFIGRNPRTVLGANATHYFLVTIDGRQTGVSVGMSFQEMADYLSTAFGITDAVNLDGGGSSTMVVNGALANAPSDSWPPGTERAVASAVMVVKRPIPAVATLTDSFPSTGRQLPWDDKFTFNDVQAFSPASPGGDGYVMAVRDPSGGLESTHVGNATDADYSVQAHIYLEYRPAESGQERYGLFARDNGNFAFNSTSYNGGYCYMMMYDTTDGRLRAGKTTNGTITDLLPAVMNITTSGWHQFRITCAGTNIRYHLDGTQILNVTDTSYSRGWAGVAYNESLTNNALIHGTRVDNFSLAPAAPAAVQDWVLYN
ncbi:MAG: phosphodiester glycosidase family protein [Candidatus Sumerlaeaceae bacterium]|nr:phosphodiester glycosidase family protein [Candidatus Sumerlaeaceae bacterium]